MFNEDFLRQILEKASSHGTDQLRNFLTDNSDKPLIAVGSGAMTGIAQFVSLIYSAGSGLSRAMTPLEMNSLSDSTLSKVKILLLSAGGHNNDIEYAAKRSLAINPEWTACICLHSGDRNRLIPLFEKAGASGRNFIFDSEYCHDGFVSYGTPLIYSTILVKMFGDDIDGHYLLRDRDGRLRIETCGGEKKGTECLHGIRHFTILHSSWGTPVATLLEGKMTESGWATCQVTDYRNYCHGRFIFTSNHLRDSTVVMIVSPRDRDLAGRIRSFLPKDVLLVTIETELDSPTATLDLLIGMTGFFTLACKTLGINPDSPANPGKIDKRVPMWIPFIAGLKKVGPLKVEKQHSDNV